MKKRLLFIVNIRSGRGMIKGSLADVLNTFQHAGYTVEVYITQSRGDAARYAQRVGAEFDRVVCSGGDGTVNEVASGLALLENRPPLAIIPSGTTNDYCHTMDIPSDIKAAAKLAVGGSPFICDTAMFGKRRFVYCAGFGIFTDVTYSTPQDQKLLFGGAAYVGEAIKNLSSYHPYDATVTYDDVVLNDRYFICLVSNTVSVAGVRRAFDTVAKLDDGLLEVTLVKMPKTLADIQKMLGVLLSIEPVGNETEFMDFAVTKSVRIRSAQPIPWTLDGESGGETTDITLSVSPKSLTVIRP